MITLKELTEKVKKGISNYIGFDVKELFDQSDYITIYGGSVRDSIAGLEIHDIDILCMPESAVKLLNFLKTKDYTTIDLVDRDAFDMYKGISLISEPWTLIKKDDVSKIIQIIRPRWKTQVQIRDHEGELSQTDMDDYQDAYFDLIKNVDISCCGVFLDRDMVLKEACKNSIIHCLSKTYIVNRWSKLYNNRRIDFREDKLKRRGWFNLKSDHRWVNKQMVKKERVLKILTLEFNPEYDYKIWTEEEYTRYKLKPFDDDIYPF